MDGGGGVPVRPGPTSKFNFCVGRCNHLSPRGYRCKDCDLECGKWRMFQRSGKSDKGEDMKRRGP